MPSRVLCFSGSKGINLTPFALINAKGRPASFGFSPLLPGTKPRLELRAGPIKILEFNDFNEKNVPSTPPIAPVSLRIS